MRVLATAVLLLFVASGWAAAGIPAGALVSTGKTPTNKVTVAPAQAAGSLDCSGAIEISLNNTYYGDNSGLLSNVSGYGCGYWYEPGGEVVYHLYLAAPAMWEASVEGSTCDLDLAVLSSCDENGGCVALVDASVATEVPVSGDIYFVVDGYSEEGCPFTFTITELPMPPPAAFCDLAVAVNDTIFYGYTCPDGQNLISSLECGATPEDGLEAYYSIVMFPGSSFTATVNSASDAALWLLDGCVEPFTCLGYADAGLGGDPEVITYTNASNGTVTVYLVVDYYGPETCGSYDLNFSFTPGEVSVERSSWGTIKGLFR
jgi:hypothetical protein